MGMEVQRVEGEGRWREKAVGTWNLLPTFSPRLTRHQPLPQTGTAWALLHDHGALQKESEREYIVLQLPDYEQTEDSSTCTRQPHRRKQMFPTK